MSGPRSGRKKESVDASSGDDDPNSFCQNLNTLFSWGGNSVYKFIWIEFMVFMVLYLSTSLIYQFLLNDNGKKDFEAIATYSSKFTSTVPIGLLLGFFTSTAMQRLFVAVNSIPGCSKTITIFATTLKGNQPEGPQYLRTYSRWVVLSWTLAFRLICKPLLKKYPSLMSLHEAELLMPHEIAELENKPENDQPLIVLDWCMALVKECRSKLEQTGDFNRNIDAILVFKKTCGNTIKFARKSIPFAMTQTVTITVFIFIAASVLARSVDANNTMNIITFYIPLINTCHCFLYYLWLKFGKSAANPFGSTVDDIDIKTLMKNHMDAASRLLNEYSAPEVTKNLVLQSFLLPCPTWMSQVSQFDQHLSVQMRMELK